MVKRAAYISENTVHVDVYYTNGKACRELCLAYSTGHINFYCWARASALSLFFCSLLVLNEWEDPLALTTLWKYTCTYTTHTYTEGVSTWHAHYLQYSKWQLASQGDTNAHIPAYKTTQMANLCLQYHTNSRLPVRETQNIHSSLQDYTDGISPVKDSTFAYNTTQMADHQSGRCTLHVYTWTCLIPGDISLQDSFLRNA